jgi:Calcineurin-like phosphoesterase
MRILLLHLSDAHFSAKQFLSESQVRALASAVLSVDSHPDGICLVISGDVAATGTVEEYAIASKFIEQLVENFQNVVSRDRVRIITVPGNHDLTDSVLGEAGDTLANDILQNNRDQTTARHTYELLLSGQANYWTFDRQWTASPAKTIDDKIFRTAEVVFGSLSLQFGLFNTAFLSRRHETQGRLWFPVHSARAATSVDSAPETISIGVFHHPYGWLESNNAVALRQFVEATFDIALNGHQHTPQSYYSTSLQSSQIWYSAGAALIGKDTSESGFGVISLDTGARTRRLTQFKWNGTLYLPETDTGVHQLESIVNRRGITLTEDFASHLDDTESLIVHTQKRHILLQDVYENSSAEGRRK